MYKQILSRIDLNLKKPFLLELPQRSAKYVEKVYKYMVCTLVQLSRNETSPNRARKTPRRNVLVSDNQ